MTSFLYSDSDLNEDAAARASPEEPATCLYFIPIAGSYCFGTIVSKGVTRCCVSSAFDKRVVVLDMKHPSSLEDLFSSCADADSGVVGKDGSKTKVHASFRDFSDSLSVSKAPKNSLQKLLGSDEERYISGPKQLSYPLSGSTDSSARHLSSSGLRNKARSYGSVVDVGGRRNTSDKDMNNQWGRPREENARRQSLSQGINTMTIIDGGINNPRAQNEDGSKAVVENSYVDDEFEDCYVKSTDKGSEESLEDKVGNVTTDNDEARAQLYFFLLTVATTHKWPDSVLARCSKALIDKYGLQSVDELRMWSVEGVESP